MATITLQEILGSDNIALSRPVINSNFTILKNAVNTLETYLNTSPNGGELEINKITLDIGTGSITDVNFISKTSGRFEGNLQVLKELTVEEVCNLNDSLIIKNNTTIERNNSTINYFDVQTRAKFEDLVNIDVDDTTITVNEATAAEINVKEYGTITKQGKNVLNIDLLGDGSIVAPVILLGEGDTGQVLFIKFPIAQTALTTYEFANSNFDPMYTSNLSISGTSNQMKKTTLMLVYSSTGWIVLNIFGPASYIL